jgi:hypothetical protein
MKAQNEFILKKKLIKNLKKNFYSQQNFSLYWKKYLTNTAEFFFIFQSPFISDFE